MSQPLVTAYFNTRKRPACDDPRIKSKVLLLEREHVSDQASTAKQDSELNESEAMSPKVIIVDTLPSTKEDARTNKAVHNIQFDSPKSSVEKTSRTPRAKALRSRKLFCTDGQQTDIRESFQKMANDDTQTKNVPFEKKGSLSPKKLMTPKKKNTENKILATGTHVSTMRNTTVRKLVNENISLDEIKNKIKESSRMMELKASIAKFKSSDKKYEQWKNQNDIKKKPQMQKFEKIELEIPVSPQKMIKSPTKALTPIRDLSKMASPQRKLLFEPKETTPSPVKSSPTKCYQKFLSLVESKTPALSLPYKYRFLAEVFRAVDTVSAMLFNRKELITFNKLKPAVQELLRHDFTLDHLAQIKTIYPEAYDYCQEKHRNFGSMTKTEKYELVVTPAVKINNGRNTPDPENVLKTAFESSMGPTILLERKRKFYDILLERVKDEHEKFLLNLETPMVVPKEKIMCWHANFDVETCKEIEKAELPKPPQVEKTTAKEVLDKAKSLFKCGTRMEKALQRLVEANMTSKSTSSSVEDSSTQTLEENVRKVNITIVDTPPNTPTTKDMYLFKGIPKALLEKVRAKQAARALEAMTRTPSVDKEAMLYSRLPELAKILRNIFVTEKKGVLPLETALQRLDNSFRTKLTSQEMEEHIRLLCKLLPMWTNIHNVRKIDYLKLDRNIDIGKVVKRLEILANEKVKI